MIWNEMLYNKPDLKAEDRLHTEPEYVSEIDKEERLKDEFDQANSLVFNWN